jgi:hypothetical protein
MRVGKNLATEIHLQIEIDKIYRSGGAIQYLTADCEKFVDGYTTDGEV